MFFKNKVRQHIIKSWTLRDQGVREELCGACSLARDVHWGRQVWQVQGGGDTDGTRMTHLCHPLCIPPFPESPTQCVPRSWHWNHVLTVRAIAVIQTLSSCGLPTSLTHGP